MSDSSSHTESLYDAMGNFGEYSGYAFLIVAISGIVLYFFARWLGIRGPWPWFGIWVFCVIIGRVGMMMHRLLSGYILLFGLAGSYLCLWAGLRQSIPDKPLVKA